MVMVIGECIRFWIWIWEGGDWKVTYEGFGPFFFVLNRPTSKVAPFLSTDITRQAYRIDFQIQFQAYPKSSTKLDLSSPLTLSPQTPNQQ